MKRLLQEWNNWMIHPRKAIMISWSVPPSLMSTKDITWRENPVTKSKTIRMQQFTIRKLFRSWKKLRRSMLITNLWSWLRSSWDSDIPWFFRPTKVKIYQRSTKESRFSKRLKSRHQRRTNLESFLHKRCLSSKKTEMEMTHLPMLTKPYLKIHKMKKCRFWSQNHCSIVKK